MKIAGHDVVITHDHLLQRGGAERVVLLLAQILDAPIVTGFYDPGSTYDEFRSIDVRPLRTDHLPKRADLHRLYLPLLAPTFSRCTVDAPLTLCSTAGWSHGVRATGRKVAFVYSPARWLYTDLAHFGSEQRFRRLALQWLKSPLQRWDQAAARSVDTFIAISSAVNERIGAAYGTESVVVHPPPSLTLDVTSDPMPIEAGYFLCVSRLLPYKHVDAVVEAMAFLPTARLVVVGTGPEREHLAEIAGPNVTLIGSVSDPQLRWLYEHSSLVVSASQEDYGLTPVEGASFGKPAVVLRWGGFTDTVAEGSTGLFFDAVDAQRIAAALEKARDIPWDSADIRQHAERFSVDSFRRNLVDALDLQRREE